jgi:hypothetical protein
VNSYLTLDRFAIASYQGSVAGTALLNMLVFVATRAVLPPDGA